MHRPGRRRRSTSLARHLDFLSSEAGEVARHADGGATSISRGAHDPSARYAGTSPSRAPRRGGIHEVGAIDARHTLTHLRHFLPSEAGKVAAVLRRRRGHERQLCAHYPRPRRGTSPSRTPRRGRNHEIGEPLSQRPDLHLYARHGRHAGAERAARVGGSSNTSCTGTRCTTLTKLPVAFSGGSRLKRAPVARGMLSTWP